MGLAIGGSLTGEIGSAKAGGEAARACALAMEAGVRASGGSVVSHDATCAPAAAFAARHLGFAGSVFIEQRDKTVSVRLYGGDGMPVPPGKIRSIEAAISKGEFMRAPAPEFGRGRTLSGVPGAYAASATADAFSLLRGAAPSGLRVHVPKQNFVNEILKLALGSSGCRLVQPGKGVLTLSADMQDQLSAIDESGQEIPAHRLTVLRALLELETGAAAVAVGPDTPAAADRLPGGRVLRAGRDGEEADRLYSAQHFMHDPVFAGARLCAGLMKTQKTLRQLNLEIPEYFTVTREAKLTSDRGRVMRALGILCADEKKQLYEGMHVSLPDGEVHISPHYSRSALSITGEGASEEIAEELCALFEKRTRLVDKEEKK
jgi:mannose-1-phosphate guanylyltransferase/phosphomannomutase